MNRYLVSAVVVLVILVVAWTVFGQPSGRGVPAEPGDEPNVVKSGQEMPQMLSPEESARMKEKWPTMSDEEKEKFRAQMREKWEQMSVQERQKLGPQMNERFGASREEQLKAIKAIEEQLAKLKEPLEGTERESQPDFSGMSPEEKTKLKEEWTKAHEERQKAVEAIVAQVAMLQGQRQTIAEGEKLIIVNTAELKAIREMALQEKAEKTALRLESIAGVRKDFGGRLPRPEPIMPEGLRGPNSPAAPRSKGQGKEGFKELLQAARKAPPFSLKSFDDKTISLSDYNGKIVVLEWLNLDCPYVKYHYDTANTMVELANKYKDKNVVWLAVNSTSNTTDQANIEFAQKHKLPYPILDDRSGKVGLSYGAMTTPQMFVIDAAGNIVYQGAIDNSPLGSIKENVVNYVDKALEELTSGKKVSIVSNKPYGCSVKYAR
jgi:peroxiredoxin